MAAVTAAWLNVPEVQLLPLEQKYERVGERPYHYRAGEFSAELRMRADGWVENYLALGQAVDH